MNIPTINIADIIKKKESISQTIPFIDWNNEDMSKYSSAKSKGFTDDDNDFLVGDSGGFLMKMNFIVKDTWRFREAATFYEENKVYTTLIPDTPNYNNYILTESKRRREGMVANCKLYKKDIVKYNNATNQKQRDKLLHPLRITGTHYSYLNYGRINRKPSDEEWEVQQQIGYKTPKDIVGFPNYWDSSYWSHKVREFKTINGYNLFIGKARRKGYSYEEASETASELNLYREQTVVLAAYDMSYLTDADATTTMAKQCLDWYENETYWARCEGIYPVEDKKNGTYQLGVKKKGQGNKVFGWKSNLISVSCAMNPSAAIGKKAVKIKVEEAGKFPNLKSMLGVTISNIESGNRRVGDITVFGTGGTKNADWSAFEYGFYNPNGYSAMPFENVWDKDSRENICGFFHSNVWGFEDNEYITLDKDGNSNLEEALKIDIINKKKAETNLTDEEYIVYIGQRANSPEEAFAVSKSNMFTSAELVTHYKKVRFDKEYQFYFDGQLVETNDNIEFKTNLELKTNAIVTHPYISNVPFRAKEDVRGCWRVWHIKPFTLNGKIPDDIYRVYYDTVGVDKEADEITNKHSLARLEVRMIPNNKTPYKIKNRRGLLVASWTGRCNTLQQDDKEALKACLRWNAKILPEVNRGEIIANFRTWKKTNLIITDPIHYIDRYNNSRRNSALGVVMTTTLKLDTLGYLRSSLYEIVGYGTDGTPILGLHYEYDEAFLLELLKFGKGNFDRISCACIQELDTLANMVINLKESGLDNDKSTQILHDLVTSRNN